jgi:hypothetical protein
MAMPAPGVAGIHRKGEVEVTEDLSLILSFSFFHP